MAAQPRATRPNPSEPPRRDRPGRKRDALLLSAADASALLNIDVQTFRKWWDDDLGGWVIPTERGSGLLIEAIKVGTDKRVSRPRLLRILEHMSDGATT